MSNTATSPPRKLGFDWSSLPSRLEVWAPHALAALRIMAALLFIQHGLMKLVSFPAAVPGAPTPLPPILIVAGVIEVFGGGLMALGLFTRTVAFFTSGMMAIAYFVGHAPHGFYPALNHGEAAVLFCFIFLFFVFAGPGAWALGAKVRAKQ